MKNTLLVIGLALGTLSCSEAQTKEVKPTSQTTQIINKVVSPSEFKAKMNLKDAQLVDVRTAGEYQGGHIGNAVNYDFYGADFAKQLEKLDKNKPVLVYCAAGGRSGKTAKMLASKGFKEVYDLDGGYGNWTK